VGLSSLKHNFTQFGVGERVPSVHPYAKFYHWGFKNVGLQRIAPPCQILRLFGQRVATAGRKTYFLDHWIKTIPAWLCITQACR